MIRHVLKIFISIFIFSQRINAQDLSKLTLPVSPAFSILDFESSSVMCPSNAKSLATDILNSFDSASALLPLAQSFKLFFDLGQLIVGHVFEVNHLVARALDCVDEFIEFQMEGLGIPVLCILNEKDHEKRDDCRAGVDHQLP